MKHAIGHEVFVAQLSCLYHRIAVIDMSITWVSSKLNSNEYDLVYKSQSYGYL